VQILLIDSLIHIRTCKTKSSRVDKLRSSNIQHIKVISDQLNMTLNYTFEVISATSILGIYTEPIYRKNYSTFYQ